MNKRVISEVGNIACCFFMVVLVVLFCFGAIRYCIKMIPRLGEVATQDSKYIGFIVEQQETGIDKVIIKTTPKYPILNCPVIKNEPICHQDLIELDKKAVLSIKYYKE